MPRQVRREVFERDGTQCSYVDAEGNRCPARGFLELDHIDAKALGGAEETANLRVRCRGHNQREAERTFGRAHVDEKIHLRQERSGATTRSSFDAAGCGLKNLGFREPDVRRALAVLKAKLDAETAFVEAIVREALAVLT